MSETQVFVIRLFIDSNEFNTLRGSIESVSGGEIRMFTDGNSLLDALRQMAFSLDKMPIKEINGDQIEK